MLIHNGAYSDLKILNYEKEYDYMKPSKYMIIVLLLVSLMLAGCESQHNVSVQTDSSNQQTDQSFIGDDTSENIPSENLPNGSDENMKYRVLVCDSSNSIPNIQIDVEYDKWNHITTSETASQELSLELNNETIQGKYKYSMIKNGCNYLSHYYVYQFGQNFSINSKTGKIDSYFWGNPTQSGNIVLEEEDCINAAEQFLSNFTDVSEYNIFNSYKDGKYYIDFIKYINGIPTDDCATIIVLQDGSLYSFSSFMLGEISVDITNPFVLENADQSVYQKLSAICNKVKEEYDEIDYFIRTRSITLTESEEVALHYSVDIVCAQNHGDVQEEIECLVELMILYD